jgi:hypothetical protein
MVLRKEIDRLERELARTKEAHGILSRDSWFPISGPPDGSVHDDGYYHLFYLSKNGAHAACSLGVGDVLLVGRKEKSKIKQDVS